MSGLMQTGHYAAYVEAAYGASALALAALTAWSVLGARRWRRRAEGRGGTPRR